MVIHLPSASKNAILIANSNGIIHRVFILKKINQSSTATSAASTQYHMHPIDVIIVTSCFNLYHVTVAEESL